MNLTLIGWTLLASLCNSLANFYVLLFHYYLVSPLQASEIWSGSRVGFFSSVQPRFPFSWCTSLITSCISKRRILRVGSLFEFYLVFHILIHSTMSNHAGADSSFQTSLDRLRLWLPPLSKSVQIIPLNHLLTDTSSIPSLGSGL